MLQNGRVQLTRPVHRGDPDPEREREVLLERLLEEAVVARAVDRAVDPLVEIHELARAGVELVEEAREHVAVGAGRALGGEACGLGLEHEPHLGEPGELANVDAGDEHAAARIDLDEPFLGQAPERLADGCSTDPEPLDQLAFVDHRAGGELE